MPSTLSIGLHELRKAVGYYLGYGRTWDSMDDQQQEDVTESIKTGYRRFLHPTGTHEWTFLRPSITYGFWPTTTFGLTAATASSRVLTSTVGTFYDDMVGKTLAFSDTSDNEYTIEKVISSTVAHVTEAMVQADSGHYTTTASGTTITASAGTFYEAQEGDIITYTVSENTYTIASYTNATTVEVTASVAAADTGSLACTIPMEPVITKLDTDYLLPLDFGAFDSKLFFDEDKGYAPLKVGSQQVVLRRRQVTTSAGVPRLCSVRPVLGESGDEGADDQRYRLMFWPEPDTQYNFTFEYIAHPRMLTVSNPYPLGGMPHGDTVLEACLAAAEELLDDEESLHATAFEKRLMASVKYDQSLDVHSLGYNSDNSTMIAPPGARRRHRVSRSSVTYGGVLHGDD